MSVIEMRMLRWISGNIRYDMKLRNPLKDSGASYWLNMRVFWDGLVICT